MILMGSPRLSGRRLREVLRGSARVPRARERVLAIADFAGVLFTPAIPSATRKFVSGRCRNQHARGVRYLTASDGTSSKRPKFVRHSLRVRHGKSRFAFD